MQLNTKLNIGNTVWHVSSRDGCVRETTIIGLTVVHRPTYEAQGECQTKVVYESDDNCNFAEEHEGRFWFRSRKAIIDYLTKTLKNVGNGRKSNPVSLPRKDGLQEAFEEFFGDSTPKPPVRSSNVGLQKAFEDVFNEKQPAPPIEDFKIVIPPSVRKRVQSITEGLAKKEGCKCGLHRKSELIRRFKKLPGIREKDLNDLYEELFES
jgi:hypothetical protein